MAELVEIGGEIVKDGMRFRVTGHAANHRGEPAEQIEFIGIAAPPAKANRQRQRIEKISVRPPLKLDGAVQSKSVGEKLAKTKVPKPVRRKITRTAEAGNLAGVNPWIVMLAAALAVAALVFSRPDTSYKGPAIEVRKR